MLGRIKIILCLGSSCFARGNQELIAAIRSYLVKNQLEDRVDFKGDHCFGSCAEGPNLQIDSRLFQKISKENIDRVLDEGLLELLNT